MWRTRPLRSAVWWPTPLTRCVTRWRHYGFDWTCWECGCPNRSTTLEVDRLDSVVEDLLGLAAAETPVLHRETACDVLFVLTDRVRFWSSALTVAGLTVHVADPDPGADHTAAVPEEDLVRMLDAILSNATKYAGSGADVDIDCRAGDDHVVVSITDTGPGVSAAELPMIADRFFRASSAHGAGTGLGLAIVAALIERVGGRLEVDAHRPSGLIVRMLLPRHGSSGSLS